MFVELWIQGRYLIVDGIVDQFDGRSKEMEENSIKKTGDEDGNEKVVNWKFTPLDEMVILLYKLASTIHATAVIHSVRLNDEDDVNFL